MSLMDTLAAYLIHQIPGGMNYPDAAQLCLRLYITVEAVPKHLLPLPKEKLGDAFAELAVAGWVRDQESPHRFRYGANFHAVTDRGHWVEVIASIIKKGAEVVDSTHGEELARAAGFAKDLP